MNAFFKSEFNYCSLIFMCHSRESNNNISRLHEGCLRIIHNHKQPSFYSLLEKDSAISIDEANMVTQIF